MLRPLRQMAAAVNILFRDLVIIFQYDHNAASCLDVWQTGPKLSMLKKEKQREKK